MTQKTVLLFFSLLVLSIINLQAQDGKSLFISKCQSCHQVFKEGTGPALMNLEERHKWSDHAELLKWIQNPAAYMAKDPYTQGLKARYGSMMQAFPDFTAKDVEAVVSYINAEVANAGKKPTGPGGETETAKTSSNAIIFGVISLILAIIALILMQINSNLKKMSDDVEGVYRPEPVPFYKNKTYIALLSIILFVVGGYYVAKGAIGLGRQTNYQPEQPIYYSHKVHAGINQISCLYCHGAAWDSKHAAIPSVNVCMNCHKNITEYTKGPKLYDENGDEINGTAEIAKLHKYAGFDPQNPTKWDPTKAKPIEWIKIHNLPDHVFFSHDAQALTADIIDKGIVLMYYKNKNSVITPVDRDDMSRIIDVDTSGNSFGFRAGYVFKEKYLSFLVDGYKNEINSNGSAVRYVLVPGVGQARSLNNLTKKSYGEIAKLYNIGD